MHRLLISFILLAVLAGCQSPFSLAPTRALLRVTGPEVYLNGERVSQQTRTDTGDRVRTGAASSALIDWPDRTSVQLDENSDPLWLWDGAILQVNLGYGWFLINTDNYDVNIRNELCDAVASSRVVVNAVPGRSIDLYLLEGQLVFRRPEIPMLTSMQKVSIRADGGIVTGVITDAERQVLLARFERWTFPPRNDNRPADDDRNDDGGFGGDDRGTDDDGSDDGGTDDGETDGGTDDGGTDDGGTDDGGTDDGGTDDGGTDDVGSPGGGLF
jgi:hypothetical protein